MAVTEVFKISGQRRFDGVLVGENQEILSASVVEDRVRIDVAGVEVGSVRIDLGADVWRKLAAFVDGRLGGKNGS